jgi:deoxyribonuclease-4
MNTVSYRIGAYLRPKDFVSKGEDVGADWASIFLTNPRAFTGVDVNLDKDHLSFPKVVHAPYSVSIAHRDKWVRNRSLELLHEQALKAEAIGAESIVVHAGGWKKYDYESALWDWHRMADDEWPIPVLIENQAGGKHAMTRTLDQIDNLWAHVCANPQIGFCLDTAHSWGAGWTTSSFTSLYNILGGIDLIHANGSSAPWDSGMDRHSPFGEESEMDLKYVLAAVSRTKCEDLIVESKDPASDIFLLKGELSASS